MTRIVAGIAKGRQLAVPGAGTRPTSARVREALFSRLEARGAVAGALVADLYAGSGALGLEALSRGAVRADLVERSRPAARLARSNATRLGLAARVHNCDVAAFLARSAGGYDLTFVDPPYDTDSAALTAQLATLAGLLNQGATLIVERSARSAPLGPVAGLAQWDTRAYGETLVWDSIREGQ